MEQAEEETQQQLRRRNGRLAACNPCRSRKAACDHARPVCDRCSRRGDGANCVYEDGPASTRGTFEMQLPARPGGQSGRPVLPPPSPPIPHIRGDNSGSPASPTGYQGFMSHSHLFEEAKSSLPLFLDSRDALPKSNRDVGAAASSSKLAAGFKSLTPPMQQMCLYALRSLPGVNNDRVILNEAAPDQATLWDQVAVESIVRSLRSLVAMCKNQESWEGLADLICRNTSRPMREDDDMDTTEWLNQFTGANIRWESIGLLWVHLERIGDLTAALHSHRLSWRDGQFCMEMSKPHLDHCVQLARHFAGANVLLADLCRRKGVLESMIDGDGSVAVSLSTAAAVGMMTFIGLHALRNDADYKPTLVSEYKRRIFWQVFTLDKMDVSFSGRPPLISRRYCSTPMPLDIADHAWVPGGEVLADQIRTLDAQGWNTHGGLYSATMMRQRIMTATLRDELTEWALSPGIEVSIDHLIDLKERQLDMFASLPPHVAYQPLDLANTRVDIREHYMRLVIYLDHLQNIFFVERLLVRHGHPDNGDLLLTSFTMLNITLLFWTHKDKFTVSAMKRNFEWLVMQHGAPAGGVLSLELLRPTLTGPHPRDPKLSRSSIIQQLTLLVGFLDWVPVTSANGQLCLNCSTIIRKVLDHTLNAGPAPGPEQDHNFESMDWSFAAQPEFQFDLLDTFDWVRTGMP